MSKKKIHKAKSPDKEFTFKSGEVGFYGTLLAQFLIFGVFTTAGTLFLIGDFFELLLLCPIGALCIIPWFKAPIHEINVIFKNNRISIIKNKKQLVDKPISELIRIKGIGGLNHYSARFEFDDRTIKLKHIFSNKNYKTWSNSESFHKGIGNITDHLSNFYSFWQQSIRQGKGWVIYAQWNPLYKDHIAHLTNTEADNIPLKKDQSQA